MEKELLWKQISDNVVEMEEDLVEELCEKSLEMGIDPTETINKGLIDGMDRVSVLYEDGEYQEASVLFANALKICPNDKGCYLYFNRCQEKISV